LSTPAMVLSKTKAASTRMRLRRLAKIKVENEARRRLFESAGSRPAYVSYESELAMG
jgi:hypothetical protein